MCRMAMGDLLNLWYFAPALLLCACRPSARCDRAFAAKDFSTAVTACASAVAAGDHGEGKKQAQALLQLGRDEELHQLAGRGRSQPWGAPVVLASGKAWTRAQRPDLAYEEYRRALSMATAAGDADTEARSAWGLSRYHLDRTEYRTALSYARRCYAATLRTGDEDLVGIAPWTCSTCSTKSATTTVRCRCSRKRRFTGKRIRAIGHTC